MSPTPEQVSDLEKNLQTNIRAAHAAAAKPLDTDEIIGIVKQVITSLGGDISAADLKFYSELKDLAGYIAHAKEEIAAIKPKDISTSHIPRATDELDAVVGATEDATNKIMDVCDEISAIAGESDAEKSEKLIACTTKIYEACNFQDITGQRITKVVQTLKYIDEKIAALLSALGEEIKNIGGGEASGPTTKIEEKDLLNGPQLPQNAIDQSEIDRLLSGN